jgi:hypothetical protein
MPTATHLVFLSESVVVGGLFADRHFTVLPRGLRTGCCTTVSATFVFSLRSKELVTFGVGATELSKVS